jgi:CMP-N-acetylneuraminic acid synthetase
MSAKVLGIIPARGGSKGIIKKNIACLNNRPLIQYTIEPALEMKKCGVLDEVIVSTDDVEIAEISRSLGAYVPFLRPTEFSTDKSKSVDLIVHALNYFKNLQINYDYVILLQPTSPLRNSEDIRLSLLKIIDSNADSLISVYHEDHINDLVTYYKDNEYGSPLNPMHNKGIRRQENREIFVRNGAIYITKVDYLLKENIIISDSPILYEMSKIKSVDINSQDDLKLVECILNIT